MKSKFNKFVQHVRGPGSGLCIGAQDPIQVPLHVDGQTDTTEKHYIRHPVCGR